MPRIALGQLNLTVGDLAGNVEKMAAAAARATEAGAELVCFPELSITGYPPEDLVLRPEFVRDNLAALDELAAKTVDACPVVAGFVDRTERGLHNAAAYLAGGEVRVRYHKIVLPNYGVFDEKRYFVPGDRSEQVSVGGISVGFSVCEDAWQPDGPFADYGGVPLVTNINGSPYHRRQARGTPRRAPRPSARVRRLDRVRERRRRPGRDRLRRRLARDGPGRRGRLPGADVRRGPAGRRHRRGRQARAQRRRRAGPSRRSRVYRALVLGLRDYVRKNGFDDVVLGLSGGIDSAFVAALAVDALGTGRGARAGDAVPVLEPGERGGRDGRRHATRASGSTSRRSTSLRHVPVDAPTAVRDRPEDVTEENLQARIRGNLLMAISNKFGSLVLATGNKSEYAVGYATLYGDMAGGFAPIKDVPKTLVYELCAWRNDEGPAAPIPERVMTKPPSAELRPDQKDTDSLPPYEVLDPIIEAYVEDDLGVEEIVARGHDRATVDRIVRMIDRTEYCSHCRCERAFRRP